MSFPPSFFALKFDLHILDVLVGFLPFVESFVSEAFQEDFNTISNFPMLANPQVAFMMLLFCYAYF
jgi:hypothetical protein